MAHVKLIIII